MFKATEFKENAGSYVSKIIQPGTQTCRITSISLDSPPYDKSSYFVNVTLEGREVGGEFVGVAIDKNNPSLGNYLGQVGTVKSGRYPFKDYEWKGKTISRDEQIFRWINNLAKGIGVLDKMNADNLEANTIEEYVAKATRYLINPENWCEFTIAGQEYFNEGYDNANYRLFFPKSEGKNLPYSVDGTTNFVSFDAAKHIIKKSTEVAAPVDEFGTSSPQNTAFLSNSDTTSNGNQELPF